MNNITRDHIPFAQVHVLAIADMHASDLLSCKYVQLSVVKNESSILQASCQPQPSATVTRVVRYSAHPTRSAFLFGNAQSFELQSGLYSTIHNR